MITTKKPPTFTRREAATLLQCAPLTIANREKAGTYPDPKRDSNNIRYYYVSDILELMWITHKQIYLKPMVAILFDKGYTEKADLDTYLTDEFKKFQVKITVANKENKILSDGQSTNSDK